MSLKVWLPLNGNIVNQGVVSVTTAINGTTAYTDGKFGQALSCDGATYCSATGITLNSEATIMCWAKTTVASKMLWVLDYDGTSYLNLYNYSSMILLNIGDSANNPFKTDDNQNITAITDGLWHHYAVTFGSNKAKLYIDGDYRGTATTFRDPTTTTTKIVKVGGGFGNAHTYDWNGAINDFRVYDECLFARQIKNIYNMTEKPGLILHYPLSNNGLGKKHPNLLMNTYTMPVNSTTTRGFRVSGSGTISHKDYNNLPVGTGVIRLTNSTSSAAYGGIAQDSLNWFSAGHKYSQSCWVRASANNAITDFYLQPIWITSSQTTGADTQRFTLTTEWQYVKCEGLTLLGNQSMYSAGGYSAGYCYCTIPANGWIEVCGMKVELGEEATPWEPHIFDYLTPYIKYDTIIYNEPDGSKWVKIAHHNNPAGGLFSTSSSFAQGAYIDGNRWYNIEEICNFIPKYEFMVKQALTSGGVEKRYRWIQYKNPNNAVWEDVQPSAVKRITDGVYTNGTFGGLYISRLNARACIANSNKGNWYGAFGSWTASSGGTPGYPNTVVTSGYMDLYIRIDTTTDPYIEYDISGYDNDGVRVPFNNNLFYGTGFTDVDIKTFNDFFTSPDNEDFTKYIRKYNGAASNYSFSDGVLTVLLNSTSNLGVCFVRKASDIYLTQNTYTISCEAKCNKSGAHLDIGLSYKNTSNTWVWRGGTNPQNFNNTTDWQKFTFSFTPDSDTQYISYCFTVVGTTNGTNTFSIRNCKLEQGSVATPWDIGGRLTYSEDSPKYKASMVFNQDSYIRVRPENYIIQGAKEMTWSIWAYDDDWSTYSGRQYSCTEDGGVNIEQYGNKLEWVVNVYKNAAQTTYGYATSSPDLYVNSSNLSSGWHLFTWVYTTNGTKLYVDGILTDSKVGTSYGIHFAYVPLIIGAEARGIDIPANSYLVGKLSDFRIYNKALTDLEVLSLYNNGATVDDDGTIHGQVRDL